MNLRALRAVLEGETHEDRIRRALVFVALLEPDPTDWSAPARPGVLDLGELAAWSSSAAVGRNREVGRRLVEELLEAGYVQGVELDTNTYELWIRRRLLEGCPWPVDA